jgi:hypothetical protein
MRPPLAPAIRTRSESVARSALREDAGVRARLPARFIGRRHASDATQVGDLPAAVALDVVLFVTDRDPDLAPALAEGEGAEQIPDAVGPVALNRDPRVEDVVLREADVAGEALEEAADLRMAAGGGDALAFPDGILGEDPDDPIRIVGGVADVAVFGLQLLDRLDVAQLGQLALCATARSARTTSGERPALLARSGLRIVVPRQPARSPRHRSAQAHAACDRGSRTLRPARATRGARCR